MILKIVATYCVACWCLGYWSWWSCVQDEVETAGGEATPASDGVAMFLFIASYPFVLPVCLAGAVWEVAVESRFWRRIRRTHRDYVFERVHEANLPAAPRAYFDQHTAELRELGFELLGDYRLKEEPLEYYGRCFLSDDGCTFAILCEILETQSCSFVSVLEGPAFLETSGVEDSPTFRALAERGAVTAQCLPDEDIPRSYAQHALKAREMAAERDVSLLRFRGDQLREVYVCYGRTFSREMHALGERNELPPPAVLPEPAGRVDCRDDAPETRHEFSS